MIGKQDLRKLKGKVRLLQLGVVLLLLTVSLFALNIPQPLPKPSRPFTDRFHFPEDPNSLFTITNGIEQETGLIAEGNWLLVKQTCTGCHSAKLITQNRASTEGWSQMIDWMQETQGLWDLGANEAKIVSYLAEHYAPGETGRRRSLNTKDWYLIQ